MRCMHTFPVGEECEKCLRANLANAVAKGHMIYEEATGRHRITPKGEKAFERASAPKAGVKRDD